MLKRNFLKAVGLIIIAVSLSVASPLYGQRADTLSGIPTVRQSYPGRNSPVERIHLTGKYELVSVQLGGAPNERGQKIEYPSDQLKYPVSEMNRGLTGVALKTNLLYAATLTANLGLEFGLGRKTTLDISGGYNFYDPPTGKHWRHWMVQPEFRWWFCERFNGSFIGLHLLGGQFNFAGIDFPFNVFPDLKDNRYEGEFIGAGVVFGYQWILSKRWSVEAVIGGGYVRAFYDQYGCNTCGPASSSGTKNYFGPTKAALSFIFFL